MDVAYCNTITIVGLVDNFDFFLSKLKLHSCYDLNNDSISAVLYEIVWL